MEKISLPSDRIQKTTTSKIAFIGLTAATMMITVSMIGAIQLQDASAAAGKPQFCYTSGDDTGCSPSMKECREARSSDASATSECRPFFPA